MTYYTVSGILGLCKGANEVRCPFRQRDQRFIVVFINGMRTIRTDQSSARNCANNFGGKVVCVRPKKALIKRLVKKIRSI